jgi:DnaJ-class molecular chaperone
VKENETFVKSYIETCRTCGGSGRKLPYVGSTGDFDPAPPPLTEEEKCLDCKGTGRWIMTIYRKPFGSR